MSRFGNTGTFYYDPYGTVGASGGTFVYLDAGQMPQYPFEETMITDRTSLRNMGGQLYTWRNYSKTQYTFRWTYLDEAKLNQLRVMFNSNPAIVWATGGVAWGTFAITQEPTISEVQHQLYDVEMTIEEM